uniref:hypothetical protein n=1 Tax=Prevotella sp. TaxID=59823 RepID=UPI004029698F
LKRKIINDLTDWFFFHTVKSLIFFLLSIYLQLFAKKSTAILQLFAKKSMAILQLFANHIA